MPAYRKVDNRTPIDPNEHHAFWARKWYVTQLEQKFRNLLCCRFDLDFVAHTELHDGLLPPDKPTELQMQRAVDRHDRHECGCYSVDQLVHINLFEVARMRSLQDELKHLPCLIVPVDVEIYGLMIRYYQTPQRVSDRQARRLAARHFIGACSCTRLVRAEPRIVPSVWAS